jgi:hypothetical protein
MRKVALFELSSEVTRCFVMLLSAKHHVFMHIRGLSNAFVEFLCIKSHYFSCLRKLHVFCYVVMHICGLSKRIRRVFMRKVALFELSSEVTCVLLRC